MLYPMNQLGMTALGGMNYDRDWASPVWQADVVSNVTLVANHSAILGYYICDDCCPIGSNLGNVSKQAKLYNLVKSHVPTKIIAGAIQCSNTWMWTDVPSAPTAPDVTPDAAVIPVGVQPRLQLSLDLLLMENCKKTRNFLASRNSVRTIRFQRLTGNRRSLQTMGLYHSMRAAARGHVARSETGPSGTELSAQSSPTYTGSGRKAPIR